MGITVGQPKGPIQLPDIAKNRLAYKEFGLKKRQIELQEKIAEQKINDQKKKSGKYTTPKISDAKPDFNEKFRPLHDTLVSQLDNYYVQYADQLNPNNTADDDIPGVYDPKIHRFIKNYENSMLGFATHSNTWTTNANDFFKLMEKGDEEGNPWDLGLLEQHPVFLTTDRVNEKIGNTGGYVNLSDPRINSLWVGNPENGGKKQELVLKEGGDPNNISDYLTDNEGYLLDKDGGRIIEHGAYGKFQDSGNYLISDVFNQQINPSFLGVDQNGNITYRGRQYYDYFDVNMWDQGKYIKPQELNYIQSFAEGLDYTNLLTQDPNNINRKIVSKESIGNLREQIITGFSFTPPREGKSGYWGNNNGQQLAEQIAIEALLLQGITSPSKNRVADEIEKIMLNQALPTGNNKIPTTSKYDGYEIKTYNDLASEIILKQYNSYHNFEDLNKPSVSTESRESKSFGLDNLTSMTFENYDMSGNQFTTGYGDYPPAEARSEISQNIAFGSWEDLGTGDVNVGTYANTGFLTGNNTLTSAINNVNGKFTMGGRVELVPINRKTGELMNGKWDKGNQRFAVDGKYTMEQAKLCILVPCYYGTFKMSETDYNNVVDKFNPDSDWTDEDLAKYNIDPDDYSIDIFAPITRVHSKDRYEYLYGDYIDLSIGISNNGIYYKDFEAISDITPDTGYKFPGGVFNE